MDDSNMVLDWIEKEHERCDLIDKRIKELTQEFYTLNDQFEEAVNKLSTSGRWESFLIRSQLSSIDRKLDTNRDLRNKLYRMRLARTW